MRPIMLNGIADLASRPDLLSRAIVLELPVLAEESTEPESGFYERLDASMPRIFGAFLNLAAEVLALLPEVELERSPRMADFARVGVAVEQALDWPEGSFLAAYSGHQAEALKSALDADPLGAVLLKFMSEPAQLEGWSGTATELLGQLTNLADDEVKRRRNWPASAAVLGKRLKELAPAVRPTGLEIEKASSGRGTEKATRALDLLDQPGCGRRGRRGQLMPDPGTQLCAGCRRDFFGDHLDAHGQDPRATGESAGLAGPPCLLKPSEVAVRLGVSRSWVYAAAADGRLPSIRLGGTDGPLRFVPEDLDAWIETARGAGEPATPARRPSGAPLGPRRPPRGALMARGCIYSQKTEDGGRPTTSSTAPATAPRSRRRSAPTAREAQRALNAALAAVDRGEQRTTSRETFAQAADRWLASKRPRIEASTYRGYEIDLRLRLKPAFGHLKLRQITRGRIEDYLAELDAAGTLSRKTINDSLIPLRQILGRAVRDGVIAANPAENADRDDPLELPYERPTMLYLSREEALRYLDACRPWYRPLAEVLIGAGLRIGEAIALEWRDVDWDGSALNITRAAKDGGIGTPKGDRGRTVLIAPYLLELLRDHRLGADGGGTARAAGVHEPAGLAASARQRPPARARAGGKAGGPLAGPPRPRPPPHRRDALAGGRRVDLLRPAAARPPRHPDDDRPLRTPRPGRASGGRGAGRRMVARGGLRIVRGTTAGTTRAARTSRRCRAPRSDAVRAGRGVLAIVRSHTECASGRTIRSGIECCHPRQLPWGALR